MDNWACDFETTTDENDCRVWCWGACNVETLDFVHGTDIEDYIRWLKQTNGQFWFHNLAWDGEFILSYLLKSGWEWTKDKLHEKNFTTLISDLGEFYELNPAARVSATARQPEAMDIQVAYEIFRKGYRSRFGTVSKKVQHFGL